MFIIRCKYYHKENEYPNILRCPFCNKVFSECSDELAMKHIIRCAYSLNPRQYSDRRRGRPKSSEYREFDKKRIE